MIFLIQHLVPDPWNHGEIEPFQTPIFKPVKAPSKFNKNIPD